MRKDFYVYRFLDRNNNIIYVGKTTNIDKRISSHLVNARQINYKYIHYDNIYKIEYAIVPSEYHMNIYEIHYICKYKPIYNKQYKVNNVDLFDLPELDWKLYILKSFIQDCRTNFIIRHGNEKDFFTELKNNKEYYNEVMNSYLSNDIIHRNFTSYEYDDFLYN